MKPRGVEDGKGAWRYSLGTVDRAITLLRLLADLGEPAPLAELVGRLELNKATVYRLVQTLLARGFVRQVHGEGYTLGPALITIGQAALRETGLPEVAQPHMQRLHERLGEVIVLSVLDGDEIVYLARVNASQILSIRGSVGDRLPAYCTSAGQAMLAAMPDEQVRESINKFEEAGPKAPSSIDELLGFLREARKKGYALNDQELAVGHRAVAAPVRDHTDEVVAALSISVPAARVSRKQVEQFAREQLLPTVEELSVDLGATPLGEGERSVYLSMGVAA